MQHSTTHTDDSNAILRAGVLRRTLLLLVASAIPYPTRASDPPTIGEFLSSEPIVEEVAIEDLTVETQDAIEESLGLPRGEVILEDLEQSKATEPRSQPRELPATSHWLEIRPRSIDGNREPIAKADLPEDTSGLPTADSIATLMHTYRADLRLSDFIRGAAFCHRPLHFEDPYLERYGHRVGCANRWPLAHSSFHMIWKTGLLPASVALDPPWRRRLSGFDEPYWSQILKR